MRRFVDRLILVVFFGHMVLGCCWHHAHASPSNAGSSVAATSSACGHHQEQPGERSRDDRHRLCNGENCVFVRAESVSVGELSAGMDCALCDCLPSDFPTCGRINAAGPRLPPVGTSVGIHLLNQALLL